MKMRELSGKKRIITWCDEQMPSGKIAVPSAGAEILIPRGPKISYAAIGLVLDPAARLCGQGKYWSALSGMVDAEFGLPNEYRTGVDQEVELSPQSRSIGIAFSAYSPVHSDVSSFRIATKIALEILLGARRSVEDDALERVLKGEPITGEAI